MVTEIFVFTFLLTVGNLAHCQEWENILFIKMEVLLEKQEAALSQLKGMQEKQEHIEGKLQEIQEKQDHVEGQLQEMREKLQHVEINLQGSVNSNQDSLQNISAKLETLEGIHRETKGCLGREDLEHFKNISSAGQKDLEFSLHQEISGVISMLETGGIDVDECAQGKDECSPLATCRNSVGSYSCSCNPPSEGDGRTCDIDECAQGKDECSPLATCRNSVGSYSCSCNPPFEGDGRTCELPCRSPDEVLEGLGCVKLVQEYKTFEEMNATCHQAGGRLLQNFSVERLQEVGWAFGNRGWRWIGVQEGKWLESGLPLQEKLWDDGSRGSDPSRRRGLYGFMDWDHSSYSYKVGQIDCSEKTWGYCQFINPQK